MKIIFKEINQLPMIYVDATDFILGEVTPSKLINNVVIGDVFLSPLFRKPVVDGVC